MLTTTKSETKSHFAFVTLFPEAIEVWLNTSILGRAHRRGLFTFETVQLRDFSQNKHRAVDDSPYGGGSGMVLRIEPLVAAVESIRERFPQAKVIYFSPRGRRLNTGLLEALNTEGGTVPAYILVCGHYEGVDERFCRGFVDMEISLGDFVLTGGELPAVAFADALIRRLDGTLSSPEAHQQESFSILDELSGERLLEYPHFTRPPEFRGMKVPEVLLSGNHLEIQKWRNHQALQITKSVLDPSAAES